MLCTWWNMLTNTMRYRTSKQFYRCCYVYIHMFICLFIYFFIHFSSIVLMCFVGVCCTSDAFHLHNLIKQFWASVSLRVCVCVCVCVCAPPWSLCHFDTHTKLSKASTSRLGPRNTRLRSIGKATPRRKECVGMRWSVGTLSSEIVHFCVCVCIYIL